jgi:phosphate transport system substrate-binding protein
MKNRRKLVILLSSILISIIFPGCFPATGGKNDDPDRAGTIAISGAWALYPLTIRWADEYQKLHPDIHFDISAGGAGKGMADALANAVDIGMVSREIYPQEIEQGAYGIAVAKDAVFLTINYENPVWEKLQTIGVTKEKLADIYLTGKITNWGELIGAPDASVPIHIFTRSDACGAAETWATFLGKRQEDLLGIGVYGDPGVLESVIKDPLAIGFNNLNYAFDFETGFPVTGIMVVPLDVNSNGAVDPDEIISNKDLALQAVSTGIYPSPPARDLYLVTGGIPQGLGRDFILWVLDDGQSFVRETGYIPIPTAMLEMERNSLIQ